MTNPVIDLQKTKASKDAGLLPRRHSGFSINCKGTSTFSFNCK